MSKTGGAMCPKCGSTALHIQRFYPKGSYPKPVDELSCVICGNIIIDGKAINHAMANNPAEVGLYMINPIATRFTDT